MNCWKLQREEKRGDSARPISLVKTKVNSLNDRDLSLRAEDTADLTSPGLDLCKTFVLMGQVSWDGEAKSIL